MVYGSGEIEDPNEPDVSFVNGPYSFKEYLLHMCEPYFWGDGIILMVLSYMWNVRITVVGLGTRPDGSNAPLLMPYRHSKPLKDTDIVLLYDMDQHYSSVGELGWGYGESKSKVGRRRNVICVETKNLLFFIDAYSRLIENCCFIHCS